MSLLRPRWRGDAQAAEYGDRPGSGPWRGSRSVPGDPALCDPIGRWSALPSPPPPARLLGQSPRSYWGDMATVPAQGTERELGSSGLGHSLCFLPALPRWTCDHCLASGSLGFPGSSADTGGSQAYAGRVHSLLSLRWDGSKWQNNATKSASCPPTSPTSPLLRPV